MLNLEYQNMITEYIDRINRHEVDEENEEDRVILPDTALSYVYTFLSHFSNFEITDYNENSGLIDYDCSYCYSNGLVLSYSMWNNQCELHFIEEHICPIEND